MFNKISMENQLEMEGGSDEQAPEEAWFELNDDFSRRISIKDAIE